MSGFRDALHGGMSNVSYNHALVRIALLWPRRHENEFERAILWGCIRYVQEARRA